ncbi:MULTISPECIES: type II toxin-antitoxin system antitoxin SocA domain-containing protein [unclassified Iodidimonas]|uniref:Panacea domain-containing protein n=1 Tax=unclassified Iodidimonas TaxID=2626145 RepID=UPI0024828C7B|nr:MULTISPECIES: type II toxin-antitoxin system antitoxin SocA domain-containing protein [unclassified Iodidimonas]
MASSISVTNYLLSLADEADATLTPMQVLKLVYIAHGWNLGLYGNPLINEEIQAWQYGPVIPELYAKIKKYRSNPVKKRLPDEVDGSLGDREKNLIEQVFKIYGKKSGPALSRLTHQPGSPWALTYREGEFGKVISNDIIQDHYSRLANKN